MPELDPFDARLAKAVHSFADRASTRVDAVEVTRRAAAAHPRSRGAWLSAPLPVPAIVVILSLLLLVLFAWTLAGAPRQSDPLPQPAATLPADLLAPTHVTGTGEVAIQVPGSTTPVGGVDRTTGIVVVTTDTTDDVRANGTGALELRVDAIASLGFVAGTLHLESPLGAWDGPCTGATWDAMPNGRLDCRLAGSGAWTGLTYLRTTQTTDAGTSVGGVILPDATPAP